MYNIMNNIDVYDLIIVYILAIIILVLAKPNFLYDHRNNKFKVYIVSDGVSFSLLPVLGAAISLIIYGVVALI